MKNASKSILAVLGLTLVLAACTTKSDKPADVQDSVKTDTIQTVTPDTTAVTSDSTVSE